MWSQQGKKCGEVWNSGLAVAGLQGSVFPQFLWGVFIIVFYSSRLSLLLILPFYMQYVSILVALKMWKCRRETHPYFHHPKTVLTSRYIFFVLFLCTGFWFVNMVVVVLSCNSVNNKNKAKSKIILRLFFFQRMCLVVGNFVRTCCCW